MRWNRHYKEGMPAASWLGLFWVYTGAAWLLGLFLMVNWGWPAGAVAVAVRLIGTLCLGVGMAATERWAWAGGVCLAAFYAAAGAAGSVLMALALVGTGGAAPWTLVGWLPAGWGFTVEMCRGALPFTLAAAAAGVLTLALLWRDQAEFNVPYRRPFTTLTDSGVLLALPIVMTDLYLAYGWWTLSAR